MLLQVHDRRPIFTTMMAFIAVAQLNCRGNYWTLLLDCLRRLSMSAISGCQWSFNSSGHLMNIKENIGSLKHRWETFETVFGLNNSKWLLGLTKRRQYHDSSPVIVVIVISRMNCEEWTPKWNDFVETENSHRRVCCWERLKGEEWHTESTEKCKSSTDIWSFQFKSWEEKGSVGSMACDVGSFFFLLCDISSNSESETTFILHFFSGFPSSWSSCRFVSRLFL